MCADLPHVTMKRGGARNPAGMDEHAVAALQIGSIFLELKREGLARRQNPGAANGAKVLHSKWQAAVIKEIRQILIRIPALALDEPCVSPEVRQFRRLRSAGPVSETVRSLSA